MICLDGTPVEATRFPDNTSQVWKICKDLLSRLRVSGEVAEVKWEFSHEGEFMELAQLKQLLDKLQIRSRLVMGYLPYGRQDKEIKNDCTFALHTFAFLLNQLEFESVYVLDPHSSVAKRLINNFYAAYPEAEVKNVLNRLPVYPDKGAKREHG